MALGNTITGLSNLMGFSLFYIFKFFENLSAGYVAILLTMSIFFMIIVFFKIMKKGVKSVGN